MVCLCWNLERCGGGRVARPVVLEATHEEALAACDLEMLESHAA